SGSAPGRARRRRAPAGPRSTAPRRRSCAASASRYAPRAGRCAARRGEPPPPPSPGRLHRSTDRFLETVTEAADGGDDVGAQFLADARDEYLDGVRIAVEILVVDMLDELGPADHLALVVHEVGQQFIFLGRELDRLAVLGDLARARVEADIAGLELRRRVARGAADQGAQ